MTARRTAAALAVLATLAAALGPGTAAAAVPDRPCDGVTVEGGNEVVGYLPGSDRPLVDQATLYPGTRLTLVVCSGSGDQLFDFRGDDRLRNVSVRDGGFQIVVGVTDEAAGGTVEVATRERIPQKSGLSGLSIRVPAAPTVTSNATGNSLEFRTAGAADEYSDAEAAFLSNLSAAQSNVSTLRSMAAAAENGSLDPSAANDSSVRATVEALDDANATLARLNGSLHGAAWRTGEADRHLNQSAALRGMLDDNETAAREALTDYEDALRARESAAAGQAWRDLLVGLVPGLVVGLVAGFWRVYRVYGAEAYDRQFTRDAGLSRRILGLPALVAGLALVAALAAIWQFGFGAFFGAIL